MKAKTFNYIIIILTLVILTCYLFIVDSPKNILKALKTANFNWLFYASCCIILYWLVETLVLHYICNKLSNKISLFTCFRTTMVGQLFNCITPAASGGQPAQALMLTNHNIPFGNASCVLLAKFVVYQVTLTVYSFILILLKLSYFMNVSEYAALVFIGFLVNILVVIVLIGICFFPNLTKKLSKIKILRKLNEAQHKINTEIDNFYQNFTNLKHDLKILIIPTLLSIIQLTLYFVIPYFVCLSLGVSNVSMFIVICSTAFVLMISSFVPLPGGSGGAEGGFYLFFKIFFPSTSLLAIAILLWRLITFYLPILIGMMFTKFEKSKTISEL